MLRERGHVMSPCYEDCQFLVQQRHHLGDAAILRSATGIPKLLWSLLWLAGSLAAVAAGGSMLVMGT